MAIVAVAGDCATTTAVALASAWPVDDPAVLVEADPTGGDLAAWFDMSLAPSLSTVVTSIRGGGWDDVEPHLRTAPNGLRLLPAPSRSAEAAQALSESTRHLVGVLAAAPAHTTIADAGRIASNPASHPMVGGAAVTVIVHRQSTQSPAAAAVRLQRLADQVDAFAALTTAPIVAVIGAMPFALDEIGSFVAEAAGTVPVVGLPVDELAAAVLAGRTGVSAKRLSRLPLLKASRDLAVVAQRAIERTGAGRAVAGSWGAVP